MKVYLKSEYYNAEDCERAINNNEDYFGDSKGLVLLIICGNYLKKLFNVENWIEIVFAKGRLFVQKDA